MLSDGLSPKDWQLDMMCLITQYYESLRVTGSKIESDCQVDTPGFITVWIMCHGVVQKLFGAAVVSRKMICNPTWQKPFAT
jgi:hypothetical protein